MNSPMKQEQTHREQTSGRQGNGGRGGMERKFRISRCKQLYVYVYIGITESLYTRNDRTL